jgi:cytochrome c oxidase subunit 2
MKTILATLYALAPPRTETGFGMPHDASVDGHRIDWLINVTSVFVVILFIIMCVWMLYASLKHNQTHTAEYDHGNSRHAVTVALGISAVIFFVVDGNLFVNATIDLSKAFWNFPEVEARGDVLRIEVNAHQWAWDARYAGPDGIFSSRDKPSSDDVVTLNDIRVPVGTPVLIQLASTDVIHSFFLPNFRVKQDAMPGMVNRLTFEAKETGEFDIGCAQHCGTNHYKMKARLTVLSKEDFARWVKEQSELSARAFEPKADTNWGWAWKEI